MLTDAERRTLLTIARAAMTARVVAQAYEPPRGDGALARPQGAFVTLRCDAMLRGCVGYTESTETACRDRGPMRGRRGDRGSPFQPTV